MVAAGARAVFQLVGGAVSDRFAPRTLMLISNLVRGLATAAITAIVSAGVAQLWHLYFLSVVFGVVDAFFFPASMSLVPMLLIKEHLMAGNALLRGTNRLMALVGPAVAGLVIANQSLGLAFAIDTATFVFAAIMIWLMREQNRESSASAASDGTTGELAGRSGLLSSIAEGLRYAWRHPLVRELLFFVAVIEFSFVGPSSVGLAAMAKNRFEAQGGATALGWMLSALGGGMLLGMVIAGSMNLTRGRGKLVIGSSFLVAFCLAGLGVAGSVLWAGVLLGLIGIGGGLANLTILAMLQSETERRMLGRVMGLLMFGSSVLEPLSFALAGVMADINLTILFIAGGALMLATCLLSLTGRGLLTSD
jgi:MFS family permease